MGHEIETDAVGAATYATGTAAGAAAAPAAASAAAGAGGAEFGGGAPTTADLSGEDGGQGEDGGLNEGDGGDTGPPRWQMVANALLGDVTSRGEHLYVGNVGAKYLLTTLVRYSSLKEKGMEIQGVYFH